MHTCPDCGLAHETPIVAPVAEPAPVVVEPAAGPNDNDVRIAEVTGATEIELAKIAAEQRALDLEEELARVKGERDGMRETLDALQPPVPEPVVVPAPAPPPAPEPVPDVPLPPVTPIAKESKKRRGWWDGYR